jgi:NADPH:quinone reductase
VRALISTTVGGPESLSIGTLPDVHPAVGELDVRVLACGLNFPDFLMIRDEYQERVERPFAPGSEIAGVIERVGDKVTGWKPGDRIVAVVRHGGLAERAIVPASAAFALPTDNSAIEGAGLLLTYATAYHALVDRGRLKQGQSLLVLGAAGGVGLAAIQIGKALGAEVIAAVSNSHKADAASAAGADHVIIYPADLLDRGASKELAGQFKTALQDQGADVVFDPVGGDYCEPALRCMAWAGRYLVVGFAGGIPRVPLNLLLLKGCDLRGVFWGSFADQDPELNRRNVEKLFGWWRKGVIRPRIDRVWPLEQGGEAIAWLAARRAIGKVVVQVSDS